MSKRELIWTTLPAMALLIAVAACGGDDEPATATTMAAMDADMDMDAEGDHEHTEDAALEWDGGPAPVIEVSVTGDAAAGWDVVATIEGFTFTDPATTEHAPGFGHTHVFVDGRLLTMAYEPVVHIDALEPGIHEITVVLSRNDHLDYAVDGKLISTSVDLTVAGDVTAVSLTINVSLEAGAVAVDFVGGKSAARGDVIEIVVTSDTADELHIHGYDISADVSASESTTVRFVADLPGIYEVELEGSGTVLFQFEVR